MPISVEENQRIARSLGPVAPLRAFHSEILPRLRSSTGVLYAPPTIGFEPFPPGQPLPDDGTPVPAPEPAPAPAPVPPIVVQQPQPLIRVPVEGVLSATQNDVVSCVIGPIPGPVILWSARATIGQSGTDTGLKLFFRLDFRQDGIADTFASASGEYPTGTSSATDTLFQKHLLGNDWNSNSRERRAGWFWWTPSSSGAYPGWRYQLYKVLNWNPVYLVFYVNKTATTAYTVRLECEVTPSAPT